MSSSPRTDPVPVSQLLSAAWRVVGSVLLLEPGQKLVVCGDATSRRVGGALVAAARGAGIEATVVDLDRAGDRPLSQMPTALREALAETQAAAFVASASPEEIGMRQELLAAVGELGLRHAHMPAISELAFARGMQVDFRDLAQRGQALLSRLRGARTMTSSSATGTELSVALPAEARWHAQLGEIAPARWGNLPAGALFVAPERVDGVLCVDGSIGDIAGLRWGVLTDRPVHFVVRESRVVEVTGPADLARAVRDVIERGDGSDRIGLIAIGVNTGIGAPTGEVLVDQNRPGLHVAVGDPAAGAAGAGFSARTSFAACQAYGAVEAGGAAVIDARGSVLDQEGV